MSDPNDLTTREMEVLALAWQCMETEPKVSDMTLLLEAPEVNELILTASPDQYQQASTIDWRTLTFLHLKASSLSNFADTHQYTPGSASVTLGKIKRKLKLKAAASTGIMPTTNTAVPATPRKARNNAAGQPKTPKSGKRGATNGTDGDTPSKRGKKTSKSSNDNDDDEEFAAFSVKKEEISDIKNGADAFFQVATAFATNGHDQV